MNVFFLLTIVVLASVSQIAETRPKQQSQRTNKGIRFKWTEISSEVRLESHNILVVIQLNYYY